MDRSEKRRKVWKDREANKLCIYCGKQSPQEDRKGCGDCLRKKVKTTVNFSKRNKTSSEQYRLLIKHQVIEKYGSVCACCGEKQILFLTIDHINNDGGKDRLDIFGTKNAPTTSWYLKLRREEKRKDLQVLCFNCNLGKVTNYGECPHKILNKILLPSIDNRRNPQFDSRLKIVWPSDEELINMCNTESVACVAKKLCVHFTSVSSRLKRRGKYHLVKKR